MNLLRTIIERLNQRIEVANIFDKQFNLCELNVNGNDKAWVHYIGNGQAEVVTNFDAKNGTLFWAKRSKVTVNKTDAYKVSGCKQLYITSFPLTAYAIVKKSHLPCDSEDAQDWLASRIYKLASGTDPLFKQSIGVINYEVVPTGYINEIKTLTANYEWACVSVDMDVQVITSSEDGCYDTCATGDIPLPDLQPCTPCLTEVAVDGVTIIGNGTPADPLSAIGAGGGAIVVQDEGNEVTPVATTLNFTGEGVTASLTSPGVVEVNIAGGGGGGGVTSVTGTAPIFSSGGTTPDITITQADASTDGYLSSTDWNTFNGKQDVISAGTDISIVSNVVNNTAPDQVVVLTAGTDIAVSGTYPNFTIDNTAPSSGGTVTSVDLTMPAAFSVSGNPVTTSGTLSVTAAGVATQYIRGDGQLANFPTSSGGGASVSYYLNGSVAQGTLGGVSFKQMSGTPVIGAGTDFSINADGYIQSFITNASVPNQLAIPAGNWNFEMYFSANNAGGLPRFYIDIFKLSAGTLSLIASSSANPEFITNGAVIDLYTTAVAMPSTVLIAADRLAIRVYVIHSSKTITLHTEDNHLCQVITTFSTGLTALNGLTDQVQLLAVGTSGTDFAISSASSTHTFNLPTASAANRGALSSTDWNTFNGKQDSLSAGTDISIVANVINNTAPDQVVSLIGAGTSVVTGTYPSFTITSNDSTLGTVTSVAALTIGTSGTNLSSSVATGTTTPVITLNVPTASAANRGALSSADWTTFNAKQAALVSGTNIKTINGTLLLGSGNYATPFELVVAASDEGTALTVGNGKITFRMPRAVTLTAVRASLTTAQASGSIFTVDINEGGTSILSTKLTIDNTEKTSATAATPPVISDTALADDAEITIDIDQIGNSTAKGLKVMLIGNYL